MLVLPCPQGSSPRPTVLEIIRFAAGSHAKKKISSVEILLDELRLFFIIDTLSSESSTLPVGLTVVVVKVVARRVYKK